MNSTVVCVDAGGGHNCGLVIGLKKYRTVTTVWINPNKHGLDYLVPDAKYGFNKIPAQGDELIIVSCITYDKLTEHFRKKTLGNFLKGYKRVVVVVTDGRFARFPEYYNNSFKGMDVYCNPCKIYWRGTLPVKEYYQPFDLSMIPQKKNRDITISHSPFVLAKYREKGTGLISEAARSTGAWFDLICGVPWTEALKRKAKSHIFVDQIDHYDFAKFNTAPGYVWNALGKSGIEAMHLGCMTVTRGKDKKGIIPTPPVVWTDKFKLKEVLDYYVKHDSEREDIAKEQQKWALNYASYDYAAKNILT